LTKEEFKTCFNDYFDPIRNYLYYRSGNSELATDIAQEVFMKIWEKNIDFEPNRTKGLLYKIASDLFVSQIRKNKVAEKYANSLQFDLTSESPEEVLAYEELKTNYEKALNDLSEKQRTVFLMSRIDNLTYKEIAQRLSISIKAVEKRMHIAITNLKKQLYNETK